MTGGLCTSPTSVRLIVRDTSGKFCWDSSVLYGSKDAKSDGNQGWVFLLFPFVSANRAFCVCSFFTSHATELNRSSILQTGTDCVFSVSVVPLCTLHRDISEVISEHCRLFMSYAAAELEKKRKVLDTPLPSSESKLSPDRASDKLDQVGLIFVGRVLCFFRVL